MQSDNRIIELFNRKNVINVCAPMVRYSKLQFRSLVRSYGCDLCFTPMILADSFCQSEKARQNEFSTNAMDSPLIVQFAANTVHDFVGAAYLASPYCDGVDLNCGCPQRWAKQLGLGSKMLDEPELIYDLVRQVRNRIDKPITISVKMRLTNNLRKTVEICRELDRIGISFLTVHARKPDQITGDINREALKLIQENVSVPVVANGGVRNLQECHELAEFTKCRGVMVANSILSNPQLFEGSVCTSVECVQKWVDICYNTTLTESEFSSSTIKAIPSNVTFQCFHHHLVFMLEKLLQKSERRIFNNFQHFHQVLAFLKDRFSIEPRLCSRENYSMLHSENTNYTGREELYANLRPPGIIGEKSTSITQWDSTTSDGKYFGEKVDADDGCDWSSWFSEND